MTIPVFDVAIARRRFLWIAAGSALASLAGCGSGSAPVTTTGQTDRLPTTPPSTAELTAPTESGRVHSDALRTAPGDPAVARSAMTNFGADFLRTVRGADPNTVISPYSLFTVLAMARAGANGTTAAQIDALLRLAGADAQGAAITSIDAGIAAAIAAANQSDGKVTIQAANETWVQTDFPIHQEYLDQLARQFGVSAVSANFPHDPDGIREEINTWVAERTNNLIPELFPTGSIDTSTRLVLVNALYLKAAWAQPFSAFGAPQPFTTAASAVVQVPMMKSSLQANGTRAPGWTAVTVPYSGYAVAMTLLVPDLGNFDALLASLDDDLVVAASATTGRYELTMPKFAVTSSPDVKDAAQKLGVTDIFGDTADLSGIAGRRGDLYASAFVHQAVIKVDENGTEAAAATGMAIATGASVPTETLLIDRPYVFWIADTSTGAPLFLGVVTDPSV